MTDEEYINYIKELISSSNEADYVAFVGVKYNIKDKIMSFIKNNDISCKHLWEDSVEGDKSTEDWHKLILYVTDLCNKVNPSGKVELYIKNK
ncbi:MAG: hypothetical protein IKD20_06505 [Clostridia bacterium]|nr:hypothetical protein [Clostridia bacterium]